MTSLASNGIVDSISDDSNSGGLIALGLGLVSAIVAVGLSSLLGRFGFVLAPSRGLGFGVRA